MALVFYGMPILAENNKPRLLYYLRRRGYRGFSMNRPDKIWNKLSVAEKEIGGIPNSSEDIKQAHAASISSGLAIMANNRHLYTPNVKIEKPKLNINISKYTNTGNMSKIIK